MDFFGEAYGWSRSQINEIYIEEAFPLIDKVRNRQKGERMDKLSEWLIMATSGFNIQEKLVESISSRLDELIADSNSESSPETTTNNSNKPYWMVTELDRGALNKAKAELQKVAESRSG